MANGTTLDTGTGDLAITMEDGAGLTNSAAGTISLASLNGHTITLNDSNGVSYGGYSASTLTVNGTQVFPAPAPPPSPTPSPAPSPTPIQSATTQLPQPSTTVNDAILFIVSSAITAAIQTVEAVVQNVSSKVSTAASSTGFSTTASPPTSPLPAEFVEVSTKAGSESGTAVVSVLLSPQLSAGDLEGAPASGAPMVVIASIPLLTSPVAPTLAQVAQSSKVQQSVKAVSAALSTITSGGASVHDIIVNLNSGTTKLSMTEQKAVFASIPAPKLVGGLLASGNPVDKAVGGHLQEVSGGNVKVSYADVKAVLTKGGVTGTTALSYLAMYQVVYKEAMTALFKVALQELDASPHLADIPAGRTRSVSGVTAKEGSDASRATVSTESFRQITVPQVSTETDVSGRTIVRGRIENWLPGMDLSALSNRSSIQLASLDGDSLADLLGHVLHDQVAEGASTRIEGWSGGRQVRINGRWIFVRDDGSFEVVLPSATSAGTIKLTIVDETGEVREQAVPIQAGATSGPARPAQPHKIALLIANTNYSQNGIPDLNTPANDVARVSEVLHNKLGYITRVLHNATKADIAAAIDGLHSETAEGDQVFIYYAGHGYENERTGVGYWLTLTLRGLFSGDGGGF